jgi:hypothetical protein
VRDASAWWELPRLVAQAARVERSALADAVREPRFRAAFQHMLEVAAMRREPLRETLAALAAVTG